MADFFDYRDCARAIEAMVRREVRAAAGHPAVLCYAIGNEIPSSVVRWHGARKVERFLERLYDAAKEEDPEALVTYVNYPSTEYLKLGFLDLVAFNVYLESRSRFDAYLARLHNVAGDRPVLMAEIGLDSLRNGEAGQAEALGWQIRSAFMGGCAGAFVYAWTDEWHRGGEDVRDWRFGITDAGRRPKPALETVRRAYAEIPFPADIEWPRASVVVCSYNGSRTIRECCENLRRLEYPDYEVIVVDDGSTDDTASIAESYGFRVIRTANRGLSSARNTGLRAATGEIVAYIDDDASPDPHWLNYLALAFLDPAGAEIAGVGGPNIPPPGDGLVADCVARSPGGPVHVLLSDRRAEHIPGCNMAFRRSALEAVSGFDPQFRTAGDDVDLCWRLQQAGFTLRFSPPAVVWHHRRNSIRAYFRQQRGYGSAEAMLERKWPDKYNAVGHLIWSGRIYSRPLMRLPLGARRIYHGVWGLAPYQSLYERAPNLIESLPLMPEWYLMIGLLGFLAILRVAWPPLRLASPLLVVAVTAPVVQAVRCADDVSAHDGYRRGRRRVRAWLLTTILHLVQPYARLCGRLRHGLTLWRRRGTCGCVALVPKPWTADIWSRRAREIPVRLGEIESALRSRGGSPRRGAAFDRWDLELAGGAFGASRMSVAVAHHGDGRQLMRVRCWPRISALAIALALLFGTLSVAAANDGGGPAWFFLALIAFWAVLRTAWESSSASAVFLCAITQIHHDEERDEGA